MHDRAITDGAWEVEEADVDLLVGGVFQQSADPEHEKRRNAPEANSSIAGVRECGELFFILLSICCNVVYGFTIDAAQTFKIAFLECVVCFLFCGFGAKHVALS